MFSKILIANRGEIACRVIRTCRRLGVATVAVYSEADAGALHVEMADEAVPIGPPPVAESYLKGDVIIAAAKATGAEAIHPGYGFLSENPDFVEAVEAAGLTFIGPSASAIRAMGLKDAAKALMEKAGVPVVPGYHGAEQDPTFLAGEADQIGYPVLIKARAGGGGKGMRLVEKAEAFADALASAQREATAAFGDPAVLIEKFVTSPRHIELQVFGDGTRAIHLYERDCSLQRRHQKVIEEAPAPGMTADVRAAMGAAAVRAAEAIGYAGAGTVEFIVDGSGALRPDGFWFMEMNTRLQVEHPVTEAITGLDLVEWQLRVASGEPLPLAQEDVPLRGHAMEARLYAEDVPRGFLPATGTLSHLSFPEDARIDSGVRAGDTISPHYDPMIAKVITHGPTRGAARLALSQALAETRVAGTVTNLEFLGALTRNPSFATGDVDTGLIARDLAALVPEDLPTEAVALAALGVLDLLGAPGPLDGFTLWAPLTHRVRLTAGEERHEVAVTPEGRGAFHVSGAFEHRITRLGGGPEALRLRIDDRQVTAGVLTAPGRVTVFLDGRSHVLHPVDPFAAAEAAAGGGDTIAAPMPGLVKAVRAAAGAEVAAGAPLLILEAMKMEHTLTAPRDATIAAVHVAEGAQVSDGDVLIALEPEDG
ncbi:MAG: acetyl/propionyl/methylcrotonyl-CoA carboxylase subunit alpha [Pseudomonadota bacterium]